ncbi:MAG: helix-turn-helix transcriptional regulator [Lachnotalea sp.]
MKIDRLLGILTVLLKNDIMTAPVLADKFEVSRRTINRDIEDLCKAGIPLVTLQGAGGGIRIADGYKLDKTLLTTKDMQAILIGLKSLDSVSGSNQYNQLLDKIYQGKSKDSNNNVLDASGHILIDLASYHKGSLAPKIELLREAIERSYLVEFDYYCDTGESHRVIEPYLIIFQWSSWYVWGYCKERQDYRMFKLNRLLNLEMLMTDYVRREIPPFQKDMEQIYQNNMHLVAEFEASVKWRLIEEYGIDSFTENKNGKLWFEFDFASEDNLFAWIMGFGDKVKIIEPNEVKEKYLDIISKIKNLY